MKWFYSLLLGCVQLVALAQPPRQEETQYPAARLQQDLDTLYARLQANHPNLYAHRSKADADRAYALLRQSLVQPMDGRQFSATLAPFVAGFRDGHTGVSVTFTNPVFTRYSQHHRFFPLGVVAINGQVYVSDNRYYPALPRGTAIIDINGLPATTILEQLQQSFAADGAAGAAAIAQRLFSYGLWWLYEWGDEVTITCRPDGEVQSITLPGINPEQLAQLLFNQGKVRQMHLYTDLDLAVVEISSYGSLVKSQAFIDSCFSVIRRAGTRHVVLDLRRNGGGNSAIGDYFLAYLTRQPYQVVRSKYWRLGPLVQELPATHWMHTSFARFSETARQEGAYYYSPPLPPSLPVEVADSLRVPAHLYVFTSARTFSSAHMTALAVKCSKLGTLIGQPTGERLDLTGEILEFNLPHTGISITIPTAGFRSACGDGEQVGVQPDYEVHTTLQDIITGRDPELELLKQLLGKPGKK